MRINQNKPFNDLNSKILSYANDLQNNPNEVIITEQKDGYREEMLEESIIEIESGDITFSIDKSLLSD